MDCGTPDSTLQVSRGPEIQLVLQAVRVAYGLGRRMITGRLHISLCGMCACKLQYYIMHGYS